MCPLLPFSSNAYITYIYYICLVATLGNLVITEPLNAINMIQEVRRLYIFLWTEPLSRDHVINIIENISVKQNECQKLNKHIYIPLYQVFSLISPSVAQARPQAPPQTPDFE